MDATSQQILRSRVISNEGLKLVAYYDKLGYPTQGVGHKLSNERYGSLAPYPPITEDTAMAWLDADILTASTEARQKFPWFPTLDGIRQGVIIEMVFQLGIGRLLGFVHMLAAMARAAYSNAAAEMINSEWHQETPARCERLAAIMQTGDPDAKAQEA